MTDADAVDTILTVFVSFPRVLADYDQIDVVVVVVDVVVVVVVVVVAAAVDDDDPDGGVAADL